MTTFRHVAALAAVSTLLGSVGASALVVPGTAAAATSSHSTTHHAPAKQKHAKQKHAKKSTVKKSTVKKSTVKTSSVKKSAVSTSAVKATPAKKETVNCAAMTQPVYQRINPTIGMQLLTTSASEASNSGTKFGYTTDLAVAFKAATRGSGLVAVHRLVRPKLWDAVWTGDPTEVSRLVKAGYTDNGTNFLASAVGATCTTPVFTFTKAGLHRQTASTSLADSLQKSGWTKQGVGFYAVAADTKASTPATGPSAPAPSVKPTSTPSSAAPTVAPSSVAPSSVAPSSAAPTVAPSSVAPSSAAPTVAPSSVAPSSAAPTVAPSSAAPTVAPSSAAPTAAPSTAAPVGGDPSTAPSVPSTGTGRLPSGPTGLDTTGRTIPDTDYAIPANAVFLSTTGDDANSGSQAKPVATLNRAVALAPTGGTIVVRGGVYRDWYHDAAGNWGFIGKALTFQNFPHEQVWFDGTDVVPASAFSADSLGHYTLSWSTPQFCQGQYYSRSLTDQSVSPNNGPCTHYDNAVNPSNPMAMDPQMVFVDGVQLTQVAGVDQLTAGSFVYDWANRKVVLGLNPAGHTVEVTKRPIAMILANKTSYTIRGIGFRRYATNEYNNLTQAAVYVGSSMSVFENDVFSQNAAGGVMLYNPLIGSAVRHSVFADNGYTGLWQYSSASSPVNDLVIDSNVFEHNNAEGFGEKCSASCGQAALKLTQIKGATITDNLVENSGGPANGIWCDLACTDVDITYNVVRNQNNRGIFYEVSDRGVIASNLVVNNNYGIVVGSAHTRVYNNTMIDNNNGIWVYDDPRQYGVGGWNNVGPDTTATELVGNVLWGTQNYSFKISTLLNGKPTDAATAEAMISKMNRNLVYAGSSTQASTYVWWQQNGGGTTLYKNLSDFRQVTGLESASVWGTNAGAGLVDPSAGDFRLAATPTGLVGALPGDIAGLLGGVAGQLLPGAFAPAGH